MRKGFIAGEVAVGIIAILIVSLAIILANKDAQRPTNTTTTQQEQTMELPEATGYVVDNAGVLTDETKQQLENQLKTIDSKVQVAVVTIKTYAPYYDEKEYAIKLAEKWKVGHKGIDNGIIFLIVTEDRRVRIEVGRGLEGVINDATAGRILDNDVVPYLKNNDWNGGVKSGVNAIIKEVNK